MAKAKRKQSREEEFHEAIGGYDMFAPMQEEESEQEVHSKMVRQGLVLVGLLIVQVLLFAYLIQSTTNLGR